ncbi:MAG: PD-(D/E)XK nuclease family protein [Elusimicrobiota bacterium]|jgi:DNA helicase-2/ATP-dependent DNA helicase PcrA|nr:PD-(D/E)XK nuclease family protein [Elusimicrobiota bacterium]
MQIPNNPKELNYSKVKTYRDCPYLFELKYIKGKREGLTAATSLGVSIHKTLEAYHQKSNDPSEIAKYYNRHWLAAGYKNAAEQMEYYLKGRNMLEVYEQREYGRGSVVNAVEREFIFEYEGWNFRGKIDRVDKLEDGGWDVIDYKTDAAVDEGFDVKKSLQMGIYGIGARRGWGLKEGRASIYFVALDKILSANFNDFNEREILNTFIETGKLIEAREFKPNTAHCARCLMNNRCPHSIIKPQEAA